LLHLLGCLQRESGDFARALEFSRQAQEKLEHALKAAPRDPSLRSARLGNREELVQCQFLKGDITRQRYIAEQRRILEERKNLAGPRPTRLPRFQGELAASAARLAQLLLEGNRPADALACLDEVLADHEHFMQDEQVRARKRVEANKPSANWDPSKPEVPWPVYLSVKPVEPDDLDLRRQWALLLARRSAALAGLGRGPEAVKAIRQAVTMTVGLLRRDHELRRQPASLLSAWSFLAEEVDRLEACYLYDLTCQLALASTLRDNAGLDDPGGQAVQVLRGYIVFGFDNAYKLRTDPALDALRQRHDFKKLLSDLETRVKAKESP